MIRLIAVLLLAILAPLAAAQDATVWESQVQEYEQKDRTDPPEKGQTIAVGSSSIRLWSSIEADLAPATVAGRGIGGAITTDVLFYLDRLVLVHEPSRVILYVGENDLSGDRTPQQVLDTVRQIVGGIHRRLPSAKVYLLSIKPSPLRWERWPAMRSANQLLAAYARTDARISYVDVSTPLLGANGQPVREYYVDDQLHLSRAGYVVWRDAIRPFLLDNRSSPAACSPIQSTPSGTLGVRQRNCRFGHGTS